MASTAAKLEVEQGRPRTTGMPTAVSLLFSEQPGRHRFPTETRYHTATHRNKPQHTATHCNLLQHTATHGNTRQHTATHGNIRPYTATHCNTLLHATGAAAVDGGVPERQGRRLFLDRRARATRNGRSQTPRRIRSPAQVHCSRVVPGTNPEKAAP